MTRQILANGAAAIAGWLGTVVAFYPGYMTSDVIDQLGQGRSGDYWDVHPPVMSWLLGLFDQIVPGAAGLFLFQNLMFWTGTALIVTAILRRGYWGPVLLLFFGFFPPVFALLSTVWKDVSMGCALILATGLLLSAERFRLRILVWVALLPLWYAFACRHNAIFAIVPLLLWWAVRAANARSKENWKRAAAFFVSICLVFKLSVAWATTRLTHNRESHVAQQILIFDLAAISVLTNSDLMPPYVHEADPGINLEELRREYYSSSVLPIMFDSKHPIRPTGSFANGNALRRAWLGGLVHYPFTYLRHRLNVTLSLLGISYLYPPITYARGIDPNSLAVVFPVRRANQLVMAVLDRFDRTRFFHAWIYLSLLSAAFAWARHRRRLSVPLIATAASGLLYAGAYLFIAPVDDFRLVWWSVLSSFPGILMAFARSPKTAPPGTPDVPSNRAASQR